MTALTKQIRAAMMKFILAAGFYEVLHFDFFQELKLVFLLNLLIFQAASWYSL